MRKTELLKNVVAKISEELCSKRH